VHQKKRAACNVRRLQNLSLETHLVVAWSAILVAAIAVGQRFFDPVTPSSLSV
jgi:hypothetical protein